MKFKILVPLLCLCFLSSCYTSQLVSKFSDTQVELGMSQNEFIQKFGKPFNKEMAYTYDKHKRETLFYKEDLYRGSWFIVTTAFTFVDSKLVRRKAIQSRRTSSSGKTLIFHNLLASKFPPILYQCLIRHS